MVSPEQIPSKEDWQEDSQSLYRRRDKPVGVRRRRTTAAARLFERAVWDVLIPVALLYGVYRLAENAASSQRFLFRPEQSLSISGNHVVSRDQVLEAVGFAGMESDGGLNLFRMNLAAERGQLLAIPWIKSVALTRIFPNHLAVDILERTPIAFANIAGNIELVDRDGTFLRMPSRASYDFPVLGGVDSGEDGAQRKGLLDRYIQFMVATRTEIAGSGWKASQVDVSHPDDLRVLMVQGRQTVLVHFGDKEFKRRLKTFLSVAPRVLENYPKINSMDLRYHNEIVVDPDMGTGQQQ
jgi:cell division protein FtsQ